MLVSYHQIRHLMQEEAPGAFRATGRLLHGCSWRSSLVLGLDYLSLSWRLRRCTQVQE